MNDTTGTTIWIDRETKNELQKIADEHGRTLVGQLRWLIRRELPEIDDADDVEPAADQQKPAD